MEVGFAQTFVELIRQLEQSDWPTKRVAEVARSYGLAVDLMSAVYRPSGKHFVHHLVGTASILAWCRQSHNVVNAGLLHAIYDFGDFGLATNRRRIVRERVGSDIEDVIWRYHNLRWSVQLVKDLDSGASAVSDIERDLLIMRLANHLEDHLDRGMLYYPGAGVREGRRPALGDSLVRVARAAGAEDLAQALDATFEEDARATIPDCLRSAHKKVWLQPRLDSLVRPGVAIRRGYWSVRSSIRHVVKTGLRLIGSK